MYGLFDYDRSSGKTSLIDLYSDSVTAYGEGQRLYDQDEHDGDTGHLYKVYECSQDGVPIGPEIHH